MNNIKNKVVVITGAARGIGYELAKMLSDLGAKIALLGLEPETLAKVVTELKTPSHFWELDVTDPQQFAKIVPEVVNHFGRVDIVIANAGIGFPTPVQYTQAAQFNKVVEVNLFGSVNTARAFVEELRKTKGYFLQIASLAAILPSPLMGAYTASKAGVEAFARAFTHEVEAYGVDVGVAYLSWTDTDLVRTADADPIARDLRASLPWPFCKTYPVNPVVRAIVSGILKRKKSIYGQRWVGPISYLRIAVYNSPITRRTFRKHGDLESLWLESHPIEKSSATAL